LNLNYVDSEVDSDDKIEVKFSKPVKSSGKYITYIETIGKTFSKLVDKHIGLGWDRCVFKENFQILTCLNCCAYGHKIQSCRNKPVCQICAGDHNIFQCKEKTNISCINCMKENSRHNLRHNTKHKANDVNCPIYLAHLIKAKEKTNYS